MRTKRLDILFPVLYGLFICLTTAVGGWLLACIFFSSTVLALLGGSFLVYALLFVAGLALLGGGIFLLPRLSVWGKAMRSLEMAQLRTQLDGTDRAQAQTLVQLEAKQAQLETERAEVRALEAQTEEIKARTAEMEARTAEIETRTAEIEARTAARLAAVEAREAVIEEKEKRLVLDQRRLTVWKKGFQEESVKWKAEVVETLAQYGVQSVGELPEAVQDAVCDDLFDRTEVLDPGCFRNIFRNPFSFIEEPKPLKQLANPLHHLLEEGVVQGVITAAELEEVTCPISFQVMSDPVKSTDPLQRTYDRYCLENVYFAYPGTYPFERSEMTVDPTELPRDKICYDKIQNLVKRCQTQLTTSSEPEEEGTYSPPGMVV